MLLIYMCFGLNKICIEIPFLSVSYVLKKMFQAVSLSFLFGMECSFLNIFFFYFAKKNTDLNLVHYLAVLKMNFTLFSRISNEERVL